MSRARRTKADRIDASGGPETRPTESAHEAVVPTRAAERDGAGHGDGRFKNRLLALVEVGNDISSAACVDDLFRQAVELGRQRLGFDRLGVWLVDEANPEEFVGTFGTDEHGQTRDERMMRRPVGQRDREVIASPKPTPRTRYEGQMLDLDGEIVGQGQHVAAAMIHGERLLGVVDMDNLLRRRPITDRDCELLGLYASMLAHLWSRVKAEQTLRDSDRTEKHFRGRLAALLEVSNELSKIESFDDLCRRAVELGRSRLGFDRLGIWFLREDGGSVGSFGTDEHGNVRDERGIPLAPNVGASTIAARLGPMTACRADNEPLRDDHGHAIGVGSRAGATIWDGERIIGSLHTDNLLSGQPITDEDCEVLAMYASVLGHLCSRQRAEEAHLDQVRKLTEGAERRLEEERARISKELHDELGQQLTVLNMTLAWLDGRFKDAPPPVRERLAEAKGHVDQLMQTIRHLTRSFRPILLEDQGLLDAIRLHVSDFEQRAGIACRVTAEPADLWIGDPPATTVFRIIQEALTNVARHAQATQCEVSLRYRAGTLEVRALDNGRGAAPAELSGTKSLGIVGMRERAAAVGGTLRIENVPQGGVCVTAWLPWRPLDER